MILKLSMKHQGEELYINHDLDITLNYFMARPTKVAHAFEWNGGRCCKYVNGQNIYVYGKMSSGGCLPPSLGYIHVYDHNIRTSSSLKPLGQSKPNFM